MDITTLCKLRSYDIEEIGTPSSIVSATGKGSMLGIKDQLLREVTAFNESFKSPLTLIGLKEQNKGKLSMLANNFSYPNKVN